MFKELLAVLWLLILVVEVVPIRVGDNWVNEPFVNNYRHDVLRYSRYELLTFACTLEAQVPPAALSDELNRCLKPIRKRGRRGGLRSRMKRRGDRLPLPAIMTGNVRSLKNKFDELCLRCKYDSAYRNASMICLTETWLSNKDPDSDYDLEGFSCTRSDRFGDKCKSKGGGLIIYINEAWCKNFTVVKQHCDSDIELLVIKCRPFYLPREFSQIIVSSVYIPPDGDADAAADILYTSVHNMESESPEAVEIILGDFNHCDFGSYVPHYTQYVNCTTRLDRTLDLFFCNIKCGYVSKKKVPLGISDHNMIHLVPSYRQVLKRSKPEVKKVQVWDYESEEELIGCFELTDWAVLYDEYESLDHNVDVVTCYIKFCTDMVIKCKDVTIYPNNKPWMCKDLRTLFLEKDKCLTGKDRDELKVVQKDINKRIFNCKQDYKKKVENMFRTNSTKEAWKGLKKITGLSKKRVEPHVDNLKSYCDELNKFYNRFDVFDFNSKCEELLNILKSKNDVKLVINEDEVVSTFSKIKAHKASGPDTLSGKILKLCKFQLAPVFTLLYQQSLDEACVPNAWKLSEIIPVAKKTHPNCNNDYRPVALTSVAMKCLEKIVKARLLINTDCHQDPLQFAYTKKRCVLDPTISIIHDVLHFLDTPSKKGDSRFVKILFVDFSSAFNTIQIHVLIDRLISMNVNANIIMWVHSFLYQRSQYVKFKGVLSDNVQSNTGAPQGCVLSPLLFTLYTSNCRSESENCKLYKYADDTALIGLCSNDHLSYSLEVDRFVTWCERNFLNLNVHKTKELIIDFRRSPHVHENLLINNVVVERVDNYKYLGTVIDNRLSFEKNVNVIYKKANSRLYSLRKLYHLHVDNTIINLFYISVIESVISFGIAAWYGNCTSVSKRKLQRILGHANRLGVTQSKTLGDLYKFYVLQRANIIRSDPGHPLNSLYCILRSGIRLRAELTRTARYNKSFIPSSIRLLNSQ